MNSRKLKIYLCDLTYDTIILVSDTIPINIGLIGAYLDHHLKDKVEISLSGRYGNTSEETYNTFFPVIKSFLLNSIIRNAKLQKLC